MPIVVVLLLSIAVVARAADVAQSTDGPLPSESAETNSSAIGIRFTPGISRAIGRRLAQEMKVNYDLDDAQAERVGEIISRRLLGLANENAETGRDMIELMLETSIANDGGFPKEPAVEFGAMSTALAPALRQFFTDSAAEIGKELTLKQRIRFTGDMTAVTAGLMMFENRMQRWAEGQVEENASLFRNLDEEENGQDASSSAPREPAELRRAKRSVDRWLDRRIDFESRWETYVKQAIVYYALSESQATAARAILDDCRSRAAAVKTVEWRQSVRENRIAKRLISRIEDHFRFGPLMHRVERDYEKLLQPLQALDEELKRRIEELPETEQKSAARRAAQKALAEKGMQRPPF